MPKKNGNEFYWKTDFRDLKTLMMKFKKMKLFEKRKKNNNNK